MPNDEWYTPSHIIEAARRAMDGIDLDPASCEEANATVRAARYYDQSENGLRQAWFGNVWCNPPFSSGKPRLFTMKAISERSTGRVKQICLLIPMPLHAQWFFDLSRMADAICLSEDKVRFNGTGGTIPATVMIAYMGHKIDSFINCFKRIGPILVNPNS